MISTSNDNTTKPDEQSQFILTDQQSQDVAKIIKSRLDTFNEQRRKQLLEIQANICYIVGEQNIRLVGDQILPLDKERAIESKANIILPAVQKDVAVGTQVAPTFDIVPAGTDADDRATAAACKKIYKYLQRKNGRDLKRGEAILWYDIAGIAWRKVYFDKDAVVLGINPAPYDENGISDMNHNPNLPVGAAITDGEVKLETIPPNQLIYDFRVPDPHKLEWIIHAKQVSKQFVMDQFGANVTAVLSGKFTSSNKENFFEASVMNRFQSVYSATSDTEQQTAISKMPNSTRMQLDSDKYIDYYEYWQKPSKMSPVGMFAIMLGDQVVYHSPYPFDQYPHGELPFIPSCPMSLTGVMSGAVSRVSQARPLQREYNRLRSQIAENNDVMNNGIIMAPRNAKVRYRTLDNGAGNVLEYESLQGKPTREAGITMNSQIFMYMNETKLAVDAIFAFHEPSQGRAPRNIDSAKGIMALQNADTIHMGPIVSSFEEADERCLYQMLTLAVHNYPEHKLINVVGNDFEWTVYELDKRQMRGKFNVIVKPSSSMPLDVLGEQRKAFEMWSSGLMGDPNDPELRLWTLQQMDAGNADNLLQKHSKQKNFARKEFVTAVESVKEIQLAPGVPDDVMAFEIERRIFIPPINPFDHDLVHLADHNEWVLDNYWRLRATGNPIWLALLENMMLHIQQHQLRVDMITMKAREMNTREQMLIKGKTIEQLVAPKRYEAQRQGDSNSDRK